MIWHTEVRKISELKNWESNPRTISEESYKELKKSIGDLGNFEPLVINVDGTVLAGNQRLRVHKEQGDTEVEVSVPERELTEEEIKKIGIISNRHSGEWDMEKLANEFEDVLEELGFDDLMPEVELDVKEDDYEEPEDLEVRVKLGEVWQLGKHRLMCGDSTKIEDVEKLMNGQKADMVFTDPPYRMEVEGGSNQMVGRSAAKLGEKIKDLCDFEPEEFLNVLPTVFESKRFNSYIFCNKDLVPDYLNWALKMNFAFNILFWKKPNAIPLGEQHRPDVEYLLFFRKSAIWNNGLGGISYSKLLEFGREDGKAHPTMKPIELIANEIQISSNVGGIVVDLFGGSGSTLIACEQTNRVCYMMELDEHYCTVILDRWEKLTGEKGTKLE